MPTEEAYIRMQPQADSQSWQSVMSGAGLGGSLEQVSSMSLLSEVADRSMALRAPFGAESVFSKLAAEAAPTCRRWRRPWVKLAARWLIEHGFDPSAPGCEFDVLRSQVRFSGA